MQRHIFKNLAQFCVEQYSSFDPRAWLGEGLFDGRLVADAAKYLSMTSWYGHADELEKIAVVAIERIGASTEELINVSADLQMELNDIGLDLVYFSAMVRYGIATDRLEHPPTHPVQTESDDDGDFVEDDGYDGDDIEYEPMAA